jgi:hypothetical protein
MRRLFPLLLVLTLAGCGAGTALPAKDVLAKCMTKVSPPSDQFADVSDHDRRYLIVCMRIGGYTFDNLLGDCNRQMAPTTLVRCYSRTVAKK